MAFHVLGTPETEVLEYLMIIENACCIGAASILCKLLISSDVKIR